MLNFGETRKKIAVCIGTIVLLASFIQAQNTRIMTGVIVDNILSNRSGTKNMEFKQAALYPSAIFEAE